MLDVADLPQMYSDWRSRWNDRDDRMLNIGKIAVGDWTIFDPDHDTMDIRSANMIQVALEDTAEAGAILPTVRVRPSKPGPTARSKASKMEKIGMGYLEASDWERLVHEAHLEWLTFGFSPWVVWPDPDLGFPVLEKRDPRQCYPEAGWRTGQEVRRCLFARVVYYNALPDEHRMKIGVRLDNHNLDFENLQVTLVEYFDEHEVVVAGLVNTAPKLWSGDNRSGVVTMTPIELVRIPNRAGICQVILDDKISVDGEPRGQFDQVIGILEAHARLMGLVLDYADQAVYSDVWVKDLIGPMPYGGGAYIELGANGSIGRLAPAVSSLDVQRDLERLEEALHLGARWPKNRPGDVDQAIASAKFVEATAGIMNTAVRTMHQSFSRALGRALRVMYATDKLAMSGQKVATGVLRNQEFIEEYDTKDIDLTFKVKVDFGTGLGRDVAQSAVLGIQLGQAELMSKESVMEATEGIQDVSRELIRLDTEKMRSILLAQILQQAEAGMLPPDALPKIMKARLDGKELADIYDEFVVQPQQEALAQATGTGLGAGPLGPDGQPLPPGLGGGPGGPTPGVPAAPNPVEMLARLGTPAGPGGTLGTQVQTRN